MIAAAGRLVARIPRRQGQRALTSAIALPAAYLAIALLVRLIMIGKPAVQVDEQFYLLVGQRMAEGALPYVDLWDRKPYGLFLIYRGMFALPFDPVLAYQTAGIVCSVATAMVIARMARMIAPERGAMLAGLAYLLYQPTFNVALGQSPVFYNLPVALAALAVVHASLRAGDERLTANGCGAMLLLGLAMQIKYTAMFEGIGLGLLLLARALADGWRPERLVGTSLLWIGMALAPTFAVLAGYALAGHAEAFVQANFLSIFGRRNDWADAGAQISKETLAMMPFALAILLAPRRIGLSGGNAPLALRPLRVWALFSLGGFLMVPPWYDHYLGPLLVPLSVLAAPALGHARPGGRWYGRLLLGLGAIGAALAPAFQVRERGTAAEFADATALVRAELHGRCLYIYEGDTALYRTSEACIPTRFAFPSHLDAMNEAGALGTDPVAEVRRIMASHPGVVVMAESGRPNLPNLATRALMHQALTRGYERYAGVTLGTRKFGLYRLKD
ncbi:glycosyltransferase family 39 protein [Novosphingobium mangrovi (ex Huang et al. 2023)]|uniref:Glycosyltransferase family 39 protein n=1 Tax=Novosphingobium mangrovi (ex Huang et al. 2023) TaxID=2976432 RepID=A0ABT2I3J5_9SPHN|nr:glycosyltransferase family 39 protein [Novosphingobium mangrovi (ex Huang et al. 2023)]MCT2399379.1 glycosyltransferase family 39 protein [Novosphingobium mangrovi (ex Huang et al. 2023)]